MLQEKRCRLQVKRNGNWVDTGPVHPTRPHAAVYAFEHKLGRAQVDWQIVDVDP
jgi:hypothetical protein